MRTISYCLISLFLFIKIYKACLSTQFDSSGTCVSCDISCATCTGPTGSDCITCASTTTRTLDNLATTCFCKDGYTQNSPQASSCIAIVCDHSCSTCNTTSTTCTACSSTTRSLNLAAGTCDCNSKYFDAGVAACTSCYYACSQCTGSTSTSCTACNSLKFRVTDGAGGCKCSDGYFNVASTQLCSTCSYKCLTCSSSATNCLTCKSNRPTTPACLCATGYYDDGTICQLCQSTCKTCTNASTCTSCDALVNFRGLSTSSTYCVCLDGYFEQGSLVCSTCHVTCLTCTGDNLAISCVTCKSSANRILSSTSCICKDGYYQTSPSVQLCSACDFRCKTCSGTATNCLTCQSSLLRTFGTSNNCPCSTGYYQSLQTGLCTACQSSCVTCSTGTSCLTCNTTKLYQINSSSLCSCNTTYYYNTSVSLCKPCTYTCLTCLTTPTTCTSCDANRSLSSSTCPCLPLHYDDGTSICKPCHYTCQTCNGLTISTCLTCNALMFRAISSARCNCNAKYYDDGANMLCKSCLYSCKTCVDALTCATCDPTKFRSNIATFCPCNTGYYETAALLCSLCHYSCLTCTDGSTCATCNPNRFQNTSLKCQCPDKFYDDGTTEPCHACLYDCKTCLNAGACATCDSTLFRFLNGLNRCTCMTKYYESSQVCNACQYYCATCTTTIICSTCNSTANRVKDAVTNKCVCASGYYDNGIEQCQKCSYACLTCLTTSTTCTACDTTLRALSSSWCNCPQYKYDNNITAVCSLCNYSCSTCTNSTECLTCNSVKKRTFDPLTITCICMDTFYDDGTNELCGTCNYACKTCTNNTKCLLCDDTMFRSTPASMCPCITQYYNSGTNQLCLHCQYTCATCTVGTSCATCDAVTSHRTINALTNLCICEAGYFDDGLSHQLCLACDYTCATCQTSSLTCLTCNNAATHRSLIGSSCPCQNTYVDMNFDAVCQSCQYTCQTCSNLLTCDTCSSTKHRSSNLTTGHCDCTIGYYDDLLNHQLCAQCDLTCLSCSGSTACLTCDASRNRALNATVNYIGATSPFCICIYRYYSPGSSLSCLPCDYSCQVCSGSTSHSCLYCHAASHRTLSASQCLCNNGYYDDGSNQLCLICHISCSTCTGPLNSQCNSCNGSTFFMLSLTTCFVTCPDYYFNNLATMTCTHCAANCLHCTNATVCTYCDTNYYLLLSDSICYLSCPDGFYKNAANRVCDTCPEGCLTCDSNIHCFNCATHYYYDSSLTLCFSCHQYCKACLGPGQDQCLSCYQPLYFRINKCYNLTCPYSQYVDSILGCQNCSTLFANSLTCNKSTAFLCIDTYKLQNGICKTCGNVVGFHLEQSTNTCSQICGDGLLFILQCDDGNNFNGDGCSANCIIQSGWTCNSIIPQQISTCTLQNSISMKLQVSYKYPGENKVQLLFQLSLPLRIVNAFSVLVHNLSVSDYAYVFSQKTNLSEVSLVMTYNSALQGKTVQILYNPHRRLLQSALSLQFNTVLQLQTFPPVLYTNEPTLIFYQLSRTIISYSSLVLIVLSLLIIPKKMNLHALSFSYLPAKIFLIFGLAIGPKTDWINYVLKDIQIYALIGGISIGDCCTQFRSFYNYNTQFVRNSLYVLFVWIAIWMIEGLLYVYHKFVSKIPHILEYTNYFTVTIHIILPFHLFFSSITSLYNYSIQSPTQAFNITLSITISLFCLILVVVSWIMTYHTKRPKIQIINASKVIMKDNSYNEDKQDFKKQNDLVSALNQTQTMSKNISLISHNQNQQQSDQQNQQQNEKETANKILQTQTIQSQYSTQQIKKLSRNFLNWDYVSLYKNDKHSKYYMPVTFTFFYLQAILIALLVNVDSFYFIIVEGALELAYFAYLVIQRPFSSNFTNVRLIIVQILVLAMQAIVAYYLYLSINNQYYQLGQLIFVYLCQITLLFTVAFCLLEHILSWRQEVWGIVQPCLIALRLRGTKKVYDFAKHQIIADQSVVNESKDQKIIEGEYDAFYARVLKKERINKKYRKQRKMKETIYKPY